MNKTNKPKIKTVIARVPYDLWKAVKLHAFENEISMSDVVIESLDKFKRKKEKYLRKDDNVLS